MGYTVRRVRAQEWEAVRALRLEALQDPVAPLAFLTSHEFEAAHVDDFWKQRTSAAASGGSVAQFVVADDDGRWVGSATGLLEEPGTDDYAHHGVEQRQVHVVGVWLHPEHRGRGLIQQAIDAVVGWGREHGALRARLYVHADNPRAQAAYLKAGFERTGLTFESKVGPEVELAKPL
ncbi:GCN5-related N-acetyltransferase [Xylanimonas cellulosilytica DSM 15894]|uniref:GCN5-related N-acetyltransferase n=1 Tax=Xylanimonas cellulosilytica (strain DSM 15894 / JCM 12276 / CECT 5975 / KCTC 9989 / LMG 20990 / NBRC 107835 / XIL07) TaxID=446471 RepID=D1BTD4_XYLCX|nr:GNAT family N-acetyltransferase [Xylanimonas cellulosilytica]ACZ29076.1 GCN5-related N-acetyltransferase [Xylanimonas cellulosilytica DSM 15894]